MWTELTNASKQLNQAWQNFNEAEPAYIDIAIAELDAAEQKLNLLIREEKEMVV